MQISKLKTLFERGIINTFCVLIDFVLKLKLNGKSKKTLSTKNNVLIIKNDAIGDFVVWSACLSFYRQLFPPDKYCLILLCNPAVKPIAKSTGQIDEVVIMDRKKFMLNPIYRASIIKNINAFNFDTIINPSFSREFASGDLLVDFIKSKQKIGVYSDNAIDSSFWTKIGNKFYTKLYIPELNETKELRKNFSFISFLTGNEINATLPVLNGIKKEAETKAPYYVVFPGARVPIRQWETLKFAQLTALIFQKTGWRGIICGSKDEIKLAEEIKNYTSAPLDILSGSTDIMQLLDLTGGAKLVVGNETSIIHIAVALNIPSVCILGGGHYGRFVPYPEELKNLGRIPDIANYPMECFNCDWNCKFKIGKNGPAPCITNITIDSVWSKVDRMIDNLKN